MKRFRFKKIDAFTSLRSQGNPAGAVYLNEDHTITDEEMLRIARELKGFVSEVGYVQRSGEDTVHLKYYSSEREVEFCGHATIAIMYDLIREDPSLQRIPFLRIVTNKGTLLVENRIMEQDAVFISSPLPRFSPGKVGTEDLAAALRTGTGSLDTDLPVEVVNAGLETLIVPVRSLDAVLSLAPDLHELKRFCIGIEVDIITVFTPEVSDNASLYRTRVFAPTFGYLEDPATGSGNAALGYYLLKHGKWDGNIASLEQNGSRENPNTIRICTQEQEGTDKVVMFGGNATVRIEGEYLLMS